MQWVITISIVLIINTIYSFLPDSEKKKPVVLLVGVVAAGIVLVYAVKQVVSGYLNVSYAVVSEDGELQKKKNFPWEVTLSTKNGTEPVYIFNECLKDASELTVKPTKAVTPKIYNAIDGAAVQFVDSGYGNAIVKSAFTVEVKKH